MHNQKLASHSQAHKAQILLCTGCCHVQLSNCRSTSYNTRRHTYTPNVYACILHSFDAKCDMFGTSNVLFFFFLNWSNAVRVHRQMPCGKQLFGCWALRLNIGEIWDDRKQTAEQHQQLWVDHWSITIIWLPCFQKYWQNIRWSTTNRKSSMTNIRWSTASMNMNQEDTIKS